MNTVKAVFKQDAHPYSKGEEFIGFIQLMSGCQKVAIFKNCKPTENSKYRTFQSMEELLDTIDIKAIQVFNGDLIELSTKIQTHIRSRMIFRDQSINYSKSKSVVS